MMKKNNHYFGEETEAIFLEYTEAKTKTEKNRIFDSKLYPKINELVNKLVFSANMQKFTSGDVQVVINDSIAHVYTNLLPNYTPERGRAFSFLTRSLQNFLNQKKNKYIENVKKYNDIDDVDETKITIDQINRSVSSDDLSVFIDYFVEFYTYVIPLRFKNIDQKIAYSIIELFKTREHITIFNKKALYVMIREMIGCDVKTSKKITPCVKIIKRDFKKLMEYYDGEQLNITVSEFMEEINNGR